MPDDKTIPHAIKPDRSGESPRSTTTVAHWKRWKFKSSIILMVVGALAVIAYLLLSGLAKQYEGLGAALCAIACGGFLVWHTVHLFAEQDVLEEQQINVTEEAASPPQPNPAGQGTNPAKPHSESG